MIATWVEHLDLLDGCLDRAEACLAESDLDGAAVVLDELQAPNGHMPALPEELRHRAHATLWRVTQVEALVDTARARLRPEIARVANAVRTEARSEAPAALFVDQAI